MLTSFGLIRRTDAAISKNDPGVTVNFQAFDSEKTRTSLLARARERDPEAWGELVDLYGPLIAHWCRRCGFDSHDAADCTQDVLGAVARSIGQFVPKHSDGSFRAWLWTITSNKARDRIRAQARNIPGSGGSTALRTLGEIPDDGSIPTDEPTEEAQISELVARGLQQIRDEFADRTWRIFERTVLDGVATAQVASEFGITNATVRQSRSRILRRLRQQLGEVQ